MKDIAVQQRLREQTPFANIEDSLKLLTSRLAATPEDPRIWADLAVAIRCTGNLHLAIAIYRRALNMAPRTASVLSNLGGALRAVGMVDEAITVLKEAVALAPELDAARFNLGLAYEDANNLEAALQQYEGLLVSNPDRRDALMQRAFVLLKSGDLERGFAAYEKRFVTETALRPRFKQQQWSGENFEGKTLLLHAEQGMGDTFQFIRYAAIAKQRGGRIIVECQAPTAAVLKGISAIDEVHVRGAKLPHFDLQASLMSLPHIFRTSLSNVPASIPYIDVPSEYRDSVVVPPCKLRKVGIVWQSGHTDIGLHSRAVPAREFERLLEVPGVQLHSLQVERDVQDLKDAIEYGLLIDLAPQFKNFGHTADAISKLDLVITVDTAVAHLAAAMAKPVWVLLPFSSEWRWMRNRDDSPWYPTMKLFRQTVPGEWDTVMQRIIRDLMHQ
jgi:hypothetical protein